jgi:hypothetical protein
MSTENVSQNNQEILEVPVIQENEEVQTDLKKGTRSFKVKLEQNGPQYGRYNGESPYQAANKALSEIIRNRVKNNLSTDQDITFYLVESTKNSGKKIHKYVGKRMKLTNPVTYTVDNGQVITKEYKNILRKVKKSELTQVLTDTNDQTAVQQGQAVEQPLEV